MPESQSRLNYIDWMRGLACVLMFQTHCYDAWLNEANRKSTFYMYSQLGGTFPAPLFLFLAGVSFALVTSKLLRKDQSPTKILQTTLRRGAEIFALGMLFRLQEYVIAWGWAPWSDLLRVDILNTIGLSMMLMALVCRLAMSFGGCTKQLNLVAAAVGTTALISLLTPLLWTTWRPDWLPWPLESYINGVHNLGQPQAWLFPVFPWSAFAFAGLAAGFLIIGDTLRLTESTKLLMLGIFGVLLILAGKWLDARSFQIYAVYDFWHTSPNFFLIRLGCLLMILWAAYAWCRWGFALRGFSPLMQLGQASLLVYWVHIELVYGRFSILPKHTNGIFGATVGLAVICALMLLLSMARTRYKRQGISVFWRRSAPDAAG